MAFQAVPDAAEIVISYSANGLVMNTVLAAFKSGGYDLGDLVALAVAVDASVVADWLPEQTSDVLYDQTLVRGLAFQNDQETVENAGSAVGGRASLGLPNSVTFSVKKTTGLTGRSARGRIYWIGIPVNELNVNENLINASYSTEVVAACDAMRAAITATDWTAGIISRFLDKVKRDPAIIREWVDTVSVNNVVDTQRRRLP